MKKLLMLMLFICLSITSYAQIVKSASWGYKPTGGTFTWQEGGSTSPGLKLLALIYSWDYFGHTDGITPSCPNCIWQKKLTSSKTSRASRWILWEANNAPAVSGVTITSLYESYSGWVIAVPPGDLDMTLNGNKGYSLFTSAYAIKGPWQGIASDKTAFTAVAVNLGSPLDAIAVSNVGAVRSAGTLAFGYVFAKKADTLSGTYDATTSRAGIVETFTFAYALGDYTPPPFKLVGHFIGGLAFQETATAGGKTIDLGDNSYIDWPIPIRDGVPPYTCTLQYYLEDDVTPSQLPKGIKLVGCRLVGSSEEPARTLMKFRVVVVDSTGTQVYK